MPDPTRPFWLDWDYDRANADPGTGSRYGNYLSPRAKLFTEIWYDDPTMEVARIAWQIATGPIMAPPLVRHHPRVADAHLDRSDWNRQLIADIRLVSPRPAPLVNAKTAGGSYYGDYHLNCWDDYDDIADQDLTRHSYLLTEVRLLWQLPADTLPAITQVPSGRDALFRHCVQSLDVLVRALNREVAPVMKQLEQS